MRDKDGLEPFVLLFISYGPTEKADVFDQKKRSLAERMVKKLSLISAYSPPLQPMIARFSQQA